MSEGLAQGPYVVARVWFKPVTFWTQGTKPTAEPPRPTCYISVPVFSQPSDDLSAYSAADEDVQMP